jgi:hypothetical protein
MRTDLTTLPLGTLRSVHRAIESTTAKEDGHTDDHARHRNESIESDPGNLGARETTKPEWSAKSKKDLAKRSSKHA